jgi:hypothetical protein
MEPNELQPLLTTLILASTALIMVIAGLAKHRLEWRPRSRSRRRWAPWRR